MKRKNNKEIPSLILSADWHVRSDRPVCRTDDYMEAQKKKIEFILYLAEKEDCPILIAGDIGHRPIWGDRLLNWFIELNECPVVKIYTISGQHDLINHRLDKWAEGGLGVLTKKSTLAVMENHLFCYDYYIHPFPYSAKIKETTKFRDKLNVAIAHQMVIKTQKDKLWPDQKAYSGKWFLKKYPCYDLIVTGDNHQSFAVEYDGRWLINPGSIMRMTAAQIDHKPSVYLWYAKSNSVERIYLPIEDNVISREHIEEDEKRDDRIESFVSRLKDTHEIGFNFEQNLKEFFNTNRQRKRVEEKVYNSLLE